MHLHIVHNKQDLIDAFERQVISFTALAKQYDGFGDKETAAKCRHYASNAARAANGARSHIADACESQTA